MEQAASSTFPYLVYFILSVFFFFLHVIRNRAWNLPFSCVSSSDQLLIYMYIFWMQAKWMPFDKNSVQRERKNGLTQWQPFSAFSELVSPGLALRGILCQWWGSVLQTLHLEQVEQLRSMKQPCPQLQHQANSWVIVFVSSPLLGSLCCNGTGNSLCGRGHWPMLAVTGTSWRFEVCLPLGHWAVTTQKKWFCFLYNVGECSKSSSSERFALNELMSLSIAEEWARSS